MRSSMRYAAASRGGPCRATFRLGGVCRWFSALQKEGLFERINHGLVMADRERAGRLPGPAAAVIDSPSVKASESGGSRGYEAGTKFKGRKRQALVGAGGRALCRRHGKTIAAKLQKGDSSGSAAMAGAV